jgi:hypothetical protein
MATTVVAVREFSEISLRWMRCGPFAESQCWQKFQSEKAFSLSEHGVPPGLMGA